MRVRTRVRLYEVIRAIIKHRSDHNLEDEKQREVVVDDLARTLEKEFSIADKLLKF